MPSYKVRIMRDGVVKQVRVMTFITCNENNVMPTRYDGGYQTSLNASFNNAINASNGVVEISKATAIFWVDRFDDMQGGQVIKNLGFTNHINISSDSIVGDRLVFNNGNYIEIIRNTVYGDSNGLYLKYCLSDGTAVATMTDSLNGIGGQNKQVYTASIPWYNGNPNSTALEYVRIQSNGEQGGPSEWVYIQELQSVSYASHDLFVQFFTGIKTVDVDDPYLEMDDSAPSGQPSGGGIPTGNAVSIPSLPTVSVADTGFVTLFNPTLAQVKNLASYMWGSLFDISTFKKIFADPMDCILGFNLLPVSIPNGGAENVIVGNISTGVSMTKAGSQWVEVDCGTINIGTPYDNYLDYSPYTKYSIYLPYIGTVDLSADDCVGKDIHLVYHVDVLSCSCVAYLKCGDSVLYQFTGSCGYSIPLTSENFRSMISSIVSIAGSIAGVVASGGTSAPLTIGAVANTANNVMGLKPDVHRSGAIGSSAGLMGIQTPYLILQFPNPCKPAQQYKYEGYPSFVTVSVGDLSGYAEFSSIILDEVTCDEDEKQLIEDILKGGVFL